MWESQHHSLTTCTGDGLNMNVNRTRVWLTNTQKMFESRVSAGTTEQLPESEKNGVNITSWSYDMEGRAKKCVERYCEMANKATEHLYKVSTPCLDDHQLQKREMSEVCSQTVLKCLYLVFVHSHD